MIMLFCAACLAVLSEYYPILEYHILGEFTAIILENNVRENIG